MERNLLETDLQKASQVQWCIKAVFEDEGLKCGTEFVQTFGKTPVKVNKDIPGFVMNRIFGAAFRECVDKKTGK